MVFSSTTSSTNNSFRTILKQKGYKATPARLSVLTLLKKEAKPLSIATVIKKLDGQGIDQATVYRILKTFKDSGLVIEIDLQHGHAHYELVGADSKEHHHHLVCTRCGIIEDFSQCDFDQISKVVLKKAKSFAQIIQHSSELFGVCKKCAS